jgi:mono/diheme cytochrome c family protein
MSTRNDRTMRTTAARRTALAAIALSGAISIIVTLASYVHDARAQRAAPREMARGEYLARAGDCVACHTARGGEPFAGGLAMPTPFGTLYTPNITPDPENGIGKWNADDFWRALHEGRSRDGSLLYPAFPYPSYTKVVRADADAIFDYLKSLKPVRKRNRPHDMAFPFNQRKLLLGWRALYFESGEFSPHSGESAEWNRGAYLVQGLGHCDACHTSRNMFGATVKSKEFSGGVIPLQDWYAPSLTSNREAGLGQWNVDDVVDLLRKGVARRAIVFGPMAQVVHDSLQYLSEADVRAMAIYLKSIVQEGGAPDEPLQIRPTEGQSRASYEQGSKLYDLNCKSCHQANGAGVPPIYPPLANNQAISMEYAVNPIRMVLFGGFPPATRGNPRPYGMPPFAYSMNDAEVAAVVTYMRQSWGNRGTAVSAADVAKYRSVPVD